MNKVLNKKLLILVLEYFHEADFGCLPRRQMKSIIKRNKK